MARGTSRPSSLLLAAALALSACTSAQPAERSAQEAPDAVRSAPAPATSPPARPTAVPPATSAAPTAPATPSAAGRPPVTHPVSLPALMAKRFDGRDLRLGRVLARTPQYTRHFVTYRSGALRISGIMNVPRGRGPFPVVVLAHGYIDPRVYTNGRGLAREQDYLARRGYVALHVDYRNHAQSDDDPANETRLRLGYTEDVINAVLAVKSSRLPFLDPERVGLLGRSMGGGVTLNVLVVAPGLVDAAVVYASVSSNAVDNFDKWTRGDPQRRALADRIVAAYGSPERNPTFWRGVSPRTYFARVSEPVLVHHGTADDTCPIAWSRATVSGLRAAGKDVTLHTYPGEPHAFVAGWPTSMRRSVAFLERHLRA